MDYWFKVTATGQNTCVDHLVCGWQYRESNPTKSDPFCCITITHITGFAVFSQFFTAFHLFHNASAKVILACVFKRQEIYFIRAYLCNKSIRNTHVLGILIQEKRTIRHFSRYPNPTTTKPILMYTFLPPHSQGPLVLLRSFAFHWQDDNPVLYRQSLGPSIHFGLGLLPRQQRSILHPTRVGSRSFKRSKAPDYGVLGLRLLGYWDYWARARLVYYYALALI